MKKETEKKLTELAAGLSNADLMLHIGTYRALCGMVAGVSHSELKVLRGMLNIFSMELGVRTAEEALQNTADAPPGNTAP